MGRVGTAYDNAAAESLFATIKRELVHPSPLPDPRCREVCHLRVHRGLLQPATAATARSAA
jgi:transposase InsO family protein